MIVMRQVDVVYFVATKILLSVRKQNKNNEDKYTFLLH